MTISLAHPEDFGIRAELLDRSRPIEPRLYLYVERELARSTDSRSFFWVLLAALCLIRITLLRGLSEFIRRYRGHPIRYRYKEENALGIRDHDEHIGFVAQDVQKVIPEAVTENSRGYLLVNNDPILWAMLNAIQEQQRQIQEQRQQIRTQQRQIASLNGKLGVLEAALRTTGHTGKSAAVAHSSNPNLHLSSAEASCTRARGTVT
jgi:hypothetical protein